MTTTSSTSQSQTPSPVVALRGLGYRFGKTPALRDVTLEVRQGEIFGLLGPNGAGKTTLLRALLGLLPGYSGEARVLGSRARRLPQHAMAGIGYVSGDQDLPESQTLSRLLRQLGPLYPTWDAAFCATLCERFGLALDVSMRKLSRGQRMRVRLVLALAYRPRLLVLDEPFAGLDPRVRTDVIDGILDLTTQTRWTVLLATHELPIVERLADRVGILSGGRLVLTDDLERLQNCARRVEAELEEPPPSDFEWPNTWFDIKVEGCRVRFLDTAHPEADSTTGSPHASALPGLVREFSTRADLEEVYLAFDQHPSPSA